MTPQTLMNDLKTDNCDPQDIVLLVIGLLNVVFRRSLMDLISSVIR